MGISCVALAARAATAYPFTADQTFVGQSELQETGFAAFILITFFVQLAFTAMIVDLRARDDARNDRVSIRIVQRDKRWHKRAQGTANVARARLELVQLLTHEVRQPISNAQASLQSISLKLRPAKNAPNNASFALRSAQSSLDHITLSLSNIIVASTILSDEKKWASHEIEAYTFLKMSILDFDKDQKDRITISSTENSIYFESVSILMRLVLQNIIEFAIKSSKNNSNIDADLKIDFEHEMVVFDIGFFPTYAQTLDLDIFERRPSSDTEPSGVSSLGLFVVRQIARELGGDVQLLATVPGRQNFQLALPC
jgi:signal transduction histidine kinase